MGGRDFVIKYKNQISLIILILGITFSLAQMGSGMTGMAVSDGVNTKGPQQSVNFLMQERENCLAGLNSAMDNYNNCQAEREKTNSYLQTCTSEKEDAEKSLANCNVAKITLEDQLFSSKADYDELAKNSVTSICCSFSDFKSGNMLNWEISENNIICSGNYTVNCSSGEITK